MKKIKCKIIFNTRNGYCMQPIVCESITEALRIAREEEMAYRIYGMDGVFIRKGWF